MRGLDAVLAEATAVPAATTSVLVATALLALTLGSLGVYAVLSFLVSRRTQEFGIRVALGALPGDVRWLVVREGAVLCAGGLAAGVGGALVVDARAGDRAARREPGRSAHLSHRRRSRSRW